jgi:hypothetical protein
VSGPFVAVLSSPVQFRFGHQNESRRYVAHQRRELRLGKGGLSPAGHRLVLLSISKQLDDSNVDSDAGSTAKVWSVLLIKLLQPD